MNNFRAFWNLLLIHRNPAGAVKSFVGWRKGKVQVWGLSGQIIR